MDWSSKNIIVMGLGLLGGGVGTAMFFAQRGAKVTVTDLRSAEILKPSIEKLKEFSITYVLGHHREQDFVSTDLVVKNPGVPDTSLYLTAARKANVPIETEASLFLKETTTFVIGVTGTKGKTTTAHLIAGGLRACGAKTYLTGTPGTSFLSTLGEVEREQSPVVVAEFSSWDLESIAKHKLSPPVAVVTNLFPDHLNRHGTMEAYREAKAVIFDYQKPRDSVVILKSEVLMRERMSEAQGKIVLISDAHVALLPKLKIPGYHMRRNAALALAAVQETIEHEKFPFPDTVRFNEERVYSDFANFSGAPGRLESVYELGGRRFVNDTAATNPGALYAALMAFDLPIILIAGGENKGLLYDEKLFKALCQRTKHIVLLPGTASEIMIDWLSRSKCKERVESVSNMADAAQAAWKASADGDIVLLSPGAASFNLFKNEFERGDSFLAEVRHLEKQ